MAKTQNLVMEDRGTVNNDVGLVDRNLITDIFISYFKEF